MKITFNNFMGVAPKFDDEQLKDGYAVRSTNTRPGRGILEPWKAPTTLDTVATAGAKTLFKYRNKWFSSTNNVSYTKVPLKNDPYDYCIVAQAGQNPELTDNTRAEIGVGPYPADTVPLGVPIPSAPSILDKQFVDDWYQNDPDAEPPVTGGAMPTPPPLEDEYDVSSVAYAICYIDAFDRLSALSLASSTTEIKEYNFRATQKVTLQLPTVPTDLQLSHAVTGQIARVRIYRTNFAGGNAGVFQFVDEVPHSQTQYIDQTYSGDLGESPINASWNPPPNNDTSLFPNGPMQKTVVVGASLIAGHNEKLVCFAEPGAFYAYPPDYYQVFKEKIVTIVPSGSNLVVLTDSYPYVIQGAHPASMDPVRLAEPVPCSNAQGVTEVFGSVFYVSETGLWEVRGYNPKNVTSNYMTDREWRALDPSTLKLANYDGRVFIDSSSQGVTYVYDPSNPKDGLRKINQSCTAYAQLDETNDLVYTTIGSTNVEQFDSHATEFLPLGWTSKTYTFNEPLSMNILKVKANTYPVDVTIEVVKLDDTVISETRTVNSHSFVYMPFQGSYQKFRAKVDAPNTTSTLEIRSIQLAQTPSELE